MQTSTAFIARLTYFDEHKQDDSTVKFSSYNNMQHLISPGITAEASYFSHHSYCQITELPLRAPKHEKLAHQVSQKQISIMPHTFYLKFCLSASPFAAEYYRNNEKKKDTKKKKEQRHATFVHNVLLHFG